MWIVVLTSLSKIAVLPYAFVLWKLGSEGWRRILICWFFFLLWGWKFKTFCLALSNSCVSVQSSNRTCQPTEFYCFMKMCVGTENFLTEIDPNLKWNVWLRLFIENTMKQLTFFFSFGKNNFQTFGRKPFTEQIYGLKSCSQWSWWEFCCWLSCSHFTEVFFAAGGIVWLSIWRY